MEALIPRPSGSEAAYARFVRRAQIEGLLADNLVAGEPYLTCNALLLEAAEEELLRRLTNLFSHVFFKAGRAISQDVPTLIEMGFPWVAAELLAAEAPRVPLVGRFDFLRDRAGRWWLVEFNSDTPSGIREAVVADRLVYERMVQDPAIVRPNAGLRDALVEAFAHELSNLAPLSLGLVTDASELEDLAQMAFTRELLREPLADRRVEVVLGDVDDLCSRPSGLRLRGRRIGALYRYLALESTYGRPAFSAMFDEADRGRVKLLNGLFGLLLQHKGLLAWIWQHRTSPYFDPVERQAIERHLPPTWKLTEIPPSVGMETLVAKQVFGREGEEVYFGSDLSAETWQELRRRRTYVAQARVDVQEVLAAVPSSGGHVARPGFVTVGCYAVRGRWAGFYSRFGGRIITSRAKWLATFSR